MTRKRKKIEEISEDNEKVTMETLGIDYKKVSSQKNQCEKKMIGAGTLGGTNLYRQSGMV